MRTLADAERAHIISTLRKTNWAVGGRNGAAARLGLVRTTLIAKMRKLGICGKPPTNAVSASIRVNASWRPDPVQRTARLTMLWAMAIGSPAVHGKKGLEDGESLREAVEPEEHQGDVDVSADGSCSLVDRDRLRRRHTAALSSGPWQRFPLAANTFRVLLKSRF